MFDSLLSLLDAIHTHCPNIHSHTYTHQTKTQGSAERHRHRSTTTSKPPEPCTGRRCRASARSGATCMISYKPGATGTVCEWGQGTTSTSPDISSFTLNGSSSSSSSNSGISIGSSAGDYYLRFCIFSAALLKEKKDGWVTEKVHPVWVFLASRDEL